MRVKGWRKAVRRARQSARALKLGQEAAQFGYDEDWVDGFFPNVSSVGSAAGPPSEPAATAEAADEAGAAGKKK